MESSSKRWKPLTKVGTSFGESELKEINDWTNAECCLDNANAKALNTTFVIVGPKEFKLISMYSANQDVWDKLQAVFEGMSIIRMSKLQILTT
jgi:hypothetical protein